MKLISETIREKYNIDLSNPLETEVKVIEFNTSTTQTSETTFPRRDIVKAVKFYASLIEKHGIKNEIETGQKTWGVSEDGEWLVVIKDFNN